jgi:small conductance mechanosensitive channel
VRQNLEADTAHPAIEAGTQPTDAGDYGTHDADRKPIPPGGGDIDSAGEGRG